jgi:glycosyltransferase involved in cell wall biosynthesis
LISDLGAGENIFFQKQTPLSHLVKTLETMDLGIVPNRKNSATELMLPVKMLECMALGIPVVAPRLKTIEYYFSDDMVYYFKPEDVTSLSESILNALANKDGRTRKAQNAMDFLKKYGWEKHKYDLINLYRSL